MKKILKLVGYVFLSLFAIILVTLGFIIYSIESLNVSENEPLDEPIEIVLHILDKNSREKILGAYGSFGCMQARSGWDDPKNDIYALQQQTDGTYKLALKRTCESYAITVKHPDYYRVLDFVDFSRSREITGPVAPITIEMDSCNKPRTVYRLQSRHGDKLKNKHTPFIGYKYDLWSKRQDSTQSILKIATYGYDIDEFTFTTNKEKMDIWLEDIKGRFKSSFDDFDSFMSATTTYEIDQNSIAKLGKRADFVVIDSINGEKKYVKSLSIHYFKTKRNVLMRWKKNDRHTYFLISLDEQVTYDLNQEVLRLLDPRSNLYHFKNTNPPTNNKEEWEVYAGYAFKYWYQTNGSTEFYRCGNLDFNRYHDKKRNANRSNKVYK